MTTSLIQFQKTDDGYRYQLTEDGEKCQFLQFLINTSDFAWRKSPDDVTAEDERLKSIVLLSKLCAIGYLIFRPKITGVSCVVIATDYMNEVPGRSGKSLLMQFISEFIPTRQIAGKDLNSPYIWHDLSSQTRLVLMNDMPEDFMFERLLPCIAGDWVVNRKNQPVILIPYALSPKIAITTSSKIKGKGLSYDARKWELPFSDFYNYSHVPADDFGKLFFVDWDVEDWKCAYILVSDCIQLFLQYGMSMPCCII